MSRLDLVVGPNGAGKSTFVRLHIAPVWPAATFVNADVIAAERWRDDAERHAYDAAIIAAKTRARLIELRRPLIAETVFSHRSKLELINDAHRAGYFVALHAIMVPETLAVLRVSARVASGGHSVPEDKIRARFSRLWDIVADGVELADTTTFWDNSSWDEPTQVARFSDGFQVGNTTWPAWAPEVLRKRWPPES